MRRWTTRSDPARDGRFLDIGFTELQRDPIAEVRRLYEWLGDELTEDTVERMEGWSAESPRDKHGTHTYDAARFGITDAALADRFGACRDRFGPLLG